MTFHRQGEVLRGLFTRIRIPGSEHLLAIHEAHHRLVVDRLRRRIFPWFAVIFLLIIVPWIMAMKILLTPFLALLPVVIAAAVVGYGFLALADLVLWSSPETRRGKSLWKLTFSCLMMLALFAGYPFVIVSLIRRAYHSWEQEMVQPVVVRQQSFSLGEIVADPRYRVTLAVYEFLWLVISVRNDARYQAVLPGLAKPVQEADKAATASLEVLGRSFPVHSFAQNVPERSPMSWGEMHTEILVEYAAFRQKVAAALKA